MKNKTRYLIKIIISDLVNGSESRKNDAFVFESYDEALDIFNMLNVDFFTKDGQKNKLEVDVILNEDVNYLDSECGTSDHFINHVQTKKVIVKTF